MTPCRVIQIKGTCFVTIGSCCATYVTEWAQLCGRRETKKIKMQVATSFHKSYTLAPLNDKRKTFKVLSPLVWISIVSEVKAQKMGRIQQQVKTLCVLHFCAVLVKLAKCQAKKKKSLRGLNFTFRLFLLKKSGHWHCMECVHIRKQAFAQGDTQIYSIRNHYV